MGVVCQTCGQALPTVTYVDWWDFWHSQCPRDFCTDRQWSRLVSTDASHAHVAAWIGQRLPWWAYDETNGAQYDRGHARALLDRYLDLAEMAAKHDQQLLEDGDELW